MTATLTTIVAYVFDTYGVRVGVTADGFVGRPVGAACGPVGAAVRQTSWGPGFPKSGTYQPIAHPGTMRIVRHTPAGRAVIARQHPRLGGAGFPEGSVLEVSDRDACTSLAVDDGSTWGMLVRYEALDSPECGAIEAQHRKTAKLHYRC
jgi:hypothetical protein